MMRRQAAIFAIATAIAVPLGCARHEDPATGLPPPAYQTEPRSARELYQRPENLPTTEAADAGGYDTGDYVPRTDITADRNGPDAQTYGGAYVPQDEVVGGGPIYEQQYYYGHGYDPFSSEYPFGYGYPYGYYGSGYHGGYHTGFRGWYYGGHSDHDHHDDHGYYVRNNDEHVPHDRRNDNDGDRHVDRTPREPSPGLTDRQREEARDRRDSNPRPVRDAGAARQAQEQAREQQAQRARSDRPRVEQNRTAADDIARARAADRSQANRSQQSGRARDVDRTRDADRAQADANRGARNAQNRDQPLAGENRRGGTDARPARTDAPRNDAPRRDQPSRGGTDNSRRR